MSDVRTIIVDLPPEEAMQDLTPGVVGSSATPIVGEGLRDLPGPIDPIQKAMQRAPTALPVGPIERLPKALRKKADRWSIAFGAIPADEIMAIAREELGDAISEGIPPGLAEVFVARWILKNEFRMTRELRDASRGKDNAG